ncbi:MAG: leucine-rich repeat domain-containing protein [Treponema sp.]|nr:leucine-rich repeat domain-containing protein [Treponema sp.]
MSEMYIKKNGLLYSQDMRTLLGVDLSSGEFTGRVPFGVHFLEDELFTECPYESISLPDSVESIGDCLFKDSLKLKKVKLPAGVKVLPPYLFSGCSALEKVTMPDSLSELPDGLFQNCKSLTDIPFRAGITILPESVFEGCSSLTSLVIPPTVKAILSRAVADCSSLKALVIPESVEEIADDAFEGCNSLQNIRINGNNPLFFVSEEDGSLYKKTSSGDICILKISNQNQNTVEFFDNNLDDSIIEDDDFEDVDLGANEEEFYSVVDDKSSVEDEIDENIENNMNEKKENNIMADQNNVDDMLADIMGEEKARTEQFSEEKSVDDKESQVLTEMMDIMNDAGPSEAEKSAAITEDELANLFAKHEEEQTGQNEEENNSSAIDGKTQILIDSVKFSQVLEYTPAGETPSDSDLFVVAEKTVTDADGNMAFTTKLIECCNKIARIQDFKRIFLLYELPVDNEEFMQFYYHFISQKNIILACEASAPSKLSDYGKTICEKSRITLDKETLNDQRRRISIKNNSLIKLVIQDKYE